MTTSITVPEIKMLPIGGIRRNVLLLQKFFERLRSESYVVYYINSMPAITGHVVETIHIEEQSAAGAGCARDESVEDQAVAGAKQGGIKNVA